MAIGAAIYPEIQVGPGVAIAINLNARRSSATNSWDIRLTRKVEEEIDRIKEEGEICNYGVTNKEG